MEEQKLKDEMFPRIVFMGTPEFAVASLDALVNEGFNIVGVVTAPDKPAGRGMKVSESAVKKYAVMRNLKILQPEKLKNPDFLQELKNLNADLQVVVAFRMLPEVVWNMPPLGTINVHASLLPKYRGAAPINWAIINGETETGVTTFKLTHEIDTGNILLQKKIQIADDEIAGEVHDKLMKEGAELLVETIRKMISNDIEEKKQQTTGHAIHAPKIFTDTCRIDWNRTVAEVHNLVRGLSPYPGAFTELEGKTLKIFRSERSRKSADDEPKIKPGEHETDNKTYLRFRAQDGYLEIKELQLEGKRRMAVEEFLRGFRKNS